MRATAVAPRAGSRGSAGDDAATVADAALDGARCSLPGATVAVAAAAAVAVAAENDDVSRDYRSSNVAVGGGGEGACDDGADGTVEGDGDGDRVPAVAACSASRLE